MKQLNPNHPEPVVLSVSGMTCGGCAKTVERILLRVPGVTGAVIELPTGSAAVTGDASTDGLIGALRAAGYEAAIVAGATIG